ncbi:MAG: xanthine dehydrogenase family protein molybdopterin-binding subunit, partial [Egibacteraceae bacterium]
GRLMISSSSVEMGQGASTTLAQIAADATGVPLDQVDVPFPDTACAPYDLKTAASRTTFTMGSAIRAAAAELAAALSRLAAKHRDCESGDYRRLLALEGLPEVVVDGVYQSRDGLATLDERGQGNAADHWHQGAVGVEVEVDTETGRLTVLRCHAVAYAGRMVSPPRVRQQNEGSAIFGLGQTLFEEVVFDHGYAVNPNLSEYMIPSILDIPADLTSSAVESPDPAAELYGVGEMAVPPMAPAIANALFQATGVRVRTLPLTPERVLRALLGAPES